MNALRFLLLATGRLFSYGGIQLAPLTGYARDLFILPLYRLIFFTDLRLRQTIASTRGVFFLLFTSKYSLHMLVGSLVLVFGALQLDSVSASSAETGKQSILYTLMTNGEASITKERQIENVALGHGYLEESIQAVPDVDFDYEPETAIDFATDHGLEGTLALQDVPASMEIRTPVPPITVAEAPSSSVAVVAEPSSSIKIYTVKSGDTIAQIAYRHRVSIGTLIWANNLTQSSVIRPGNTLTILPVSGVLHTVKRGDTLSGLATRYGVDLATIRDTNALARNASLSTGAGLIIPGGEPVISRVASAVTPKKSKVPSQAVTPKLGIPPAPDPSLTVRVAKTPKVVGRVKVKSNVPISRIRNKAFDVYQELSSSPEDERDVPENKEETTVTKKTKLLWPTRLYVVNQYYGWNHTGLDIDGDYTDPIYASADGTVSQSGWNSGGYGLQIVLDHENGFRTRYAHASKLFVKAGDEVKRGQVIGYVGTTGRSTGTHLHYEVYLNGKRKNPLSYTR